VITPRQYQEIAEQAIWNYFANGGKGNPVCAMPTGTGKSIVIAFLIFHIMQRWPNQRILALTHVKELIKQNSDKLAEVWPCAPYGIFSAGLRKRETNLPIIFGGVASVAPAIQQMGRYDLVLIDEAHLMNGKVDSMYGSIIAYLSKLNPFLKVIGFTATPYRTGQGLLTESGLFTHIAVDMTTMKWFNWFIENSYMCMMIPKRTNTQLDVSNVGIQAGEFNKVQLENAVDLRDTTYLACKESIELGSDRECWLTFAAGVKHAEHVAEMFRSFGIPTAAVHSKMSNTARDKVIQDFKAGRIRNLVNKGVFTTGQDHPPIDLLIDLAPTWSTGLHVQKYGRMSRPFEGKLNGLGLDFAGNIPRLGPINDPVIPRPKGKGSPGVAPIRICDQCGTYNHASARVCYVCGYEFPHQIHIQATAGTEEIIRTEVPQVEEFQVNRVLYNKFQKNNIGIMRVNYVCGIRSFSEVVCLEHPGRAGHLAGEWWKRAMGTDKAPPTVDEALLWVSRLAVPTSIHVIVNRKYPEVIKKTYAEVN
jgi:DNA repair protein RadD